VEEQAAGRAEGCTGCGARLSRRRALGQMSAAALAAMAGVALVADGPRMLPVVEAAGSDANPGERKYPVPAADGVTIDREAQVILVRYQQRVYAFNLACPHENTALRWRAPDGRFQCPRHESKYRPDGTFVEGRATRNMDRFPVRRAGDSVLVDLNRLLRSDQQAQDWAAAVLVL
jgi:nitrite reductase/ring-hydroxylating ferredoxin subunit